MFEFLYLLIHIDIVQSIICDRICLTACSIKMYRMSFLLPFRDGTTDVTRTMHFGTPSDYEKVSSHSIIIYRLLFLL